MLLLDTNKISSAKTREYFKEVESSYINGNYRSAVVMLYVVTIFDILSKLQDYCNTYPDDEKVKSVLDSYTAHFSNIHPKDNTSEGNSTNAEDNINKSNDKKQYVPSKSEWERILIQGIESSTGLFDQSTKQKVDELKIWRNLSAHPILQNGTELLMPSKETTAALIHDIYSGILIKSSFCLSKDKKMAEKIANDLKSQKAIFPEGNDNSLKQYLNKKYIDVIDNYTKCVVFSDLWKFVFYFDDADCKKNRKIICRALQVIYDSAPEIICRYMSNNPKKFPITVTNDIVSDYVHCEYLNPEGIVYNAALFLVKNLKAYEAIKENPEIGAFCGVIVKDKKARVLAVVMENYDKKNDEFINAVKEELKKNLKDLETPICDALEVCYTKKGIYKDFLRLTIDFFGGSCCFHDAETNYRVAIKPYLLRLKNTTEDKNEYLEQLLSVSNSNSQIYDASYQRGLCYEMMLDIKKVFGDNIGYDKYSNLSALAEKFQFS